MSETDSQKCNHYVNKCTFYTTCCDKYFDCKRCHEENHPINITKIKCDLCKTEQEFSQQCTNCKESFGKYYCKICYIIDNRDREIMHCELCGICRVGSLETLFHCDTCGCCFHKTDKEHKCHKNATKNNCCICFGDMFSANDGTYIMDCGHSIHMICFIEYIKTNYKCPLCFKSIFDMTKYFELLDDEIAVTPMPLEYANIDKNIECFDCKEKSTTKFHVIGLKCKNCGSYNTTVIN